MQLINLGPVLVSLILHIILNWEDKGNNGINVVSPIDMNGGSIKNPSSLNASLTFTSPQNFERVFVNKEKIFSTARSFALLRQGGSVVTWGWNSHGGNSSSVFSSLSSGVTEIFSTESAFAALKDDGSVVTWGDGTIMEEIRVQFSHLFQVGLLKSSPLRISLCRP